MPPSGTKAGTVPCPAALRLPGLGICACGCRRDCYRFATFPGKAFIARDFSEIALPVNRLRYAWHGAGSAQGAASRRPLYPGLRPAKSPLRGPFDLSLQASGRAEAASVQNTALSPHPCGLPRPSGNVSAILRPSAPAVSATMVNKLTAGRTTAGQGVAAARHRAVTGGAALAGPRDDMYCLRGALAGFRGAFR
jgi:hypothetical protein